MFWRRKKIAASDDRLTIFFASDFHGSTACFKKFINGAKVYGADLLVMGGDLTGKAVMPVAEQQDGSFLAHQHGRDLSLANRGEAEEFMKRVENMGFYSIVVSEEEFKRLVSDGLAQETLFKKLVCDRVREWADFAGKKLQGSEVGLITAPGNDDFFEIDDVLNASPHIQYHEMEVTEIKGGYQMLHCGGSNKTPWNTEREYTEEEYEQRFAELVPRVRDMGRCVFNVHVPPHGTAIDKCSKLDENLQVVFEMGNPVQIHAGSTALTETLHREQPLLSLHGHIHEGRGNIKIGKTVCVNPGSVYPEGILQGVLVHLNGGEVKGLQLTQG